jgi:hypothetical protein
MRCGIIDIVSLKKRESLSASTAKYLLVLSAITTCKTLQSKDLKSISDTTPILMPEATVVKTPFKRCYHELLGNKMMSNIVMLSPSPPAFTAKQSSTHFWKSFGHRHQRLNAAFSTYPRILGSHAHMHLPFCRPSAQLLHR